MKPVILIGAGCPPALAERLCSLNVPVLTTWQAADRVPENSPVFCGRPGVVGQRAANIIQQKAGLLYIFGARLDMEQVGHRLDNYAPRAAKYVYDVDARELDKFPASWAVVQQDLSAEFRLPRIRSDARWLAWCKDLYVRFRAELDGADVVEDFADPYYFIRELSQACQEGEIIVPGSSGMQSCALLQAFKVKRGQKIILCNTIGAMGLEPMAIGAALAADRRVVCVTGDGGFYQNIQELEVVKRLRLNIKYFVFCNGGYGSITTMQDARFNLRVGSDEASGFTLPDLSCVAAVWELPFFEIRNNEDGGQIRAILDIPGATIARVHTTLAFRYACKVNSSLKNGVFETDDMGDMTPKIPNLKDLMK